MVSRIARGRPARPMTGRRVRRAGTRFGPGPEGRRPSAAARPNKEHPRSGSEGEAPQTAWARTANGRLAGSAEPRSRRHRIPRAVRESDQAMAARGGSPGCGQAPRQLEPRRRATAQPAAPPDPTSHRPGGASFGGKPTSVRPIRPARGERSGTLPRRRAPDRRRSGGGCSRGQTTTSGVAGPDQPSPPGSSWNSGGARCLQCITGAPAALPHPRCTPVWSGGHF